CPTATPSTRPARPRSLRLVPRQFPAERQVVRLAPNPSPFRALIKNSRILQLPPPRSGRGVPRLGRPPPALAAPASDHLFHHDPKVFPPRLQASRHHPLQNPHPSASRRSPPRDQHPA